MHRSELGSRLEDPQAGLYGFALLGQSFFTHSEHIIQQRRQRTQLLHLPQHHHLTLSLPQEHP